MWLIRSPVWCRMILFNIDVDVISGPRQSGKTTRLLKHVAEWQEGNESGAVLLASPHRGWSSRVKAEVDLMGLRDVRVITTHRADYELRGRWGGLFVVDDIDMLGFGHAFRLLSSAHLARMDVAISGDFG